MKYRAIQANGHHYVVRPDGSMVSFGDRPDSRLDAEGFADLKNGDLSQALFKAGPPATSDSDEQMASVASPHWGFLDHDDGR